MYSSRGGKAIDEFNYDGANRATLTVGFLTQPSEKNRSFIFFAFNDGTGFL